MDKNNCKLKILYKWIKANTSAIWHHMLHIPPIKILISQTLKQTKKTRATQKSLPFGKWRSREKEVRRMGQKQKKIRQKEQQDYAEEQEEI